MKAVKREANLWTKKQTYAKRRVCTTTIIRTTTTNTTTITAKTPTAAQIHENKEKKTHEEVGKTTESAVTRSFVVYTT